MEELHGSCIIVTNKYSTDNDQLSKVSFSSDATL